ncbi:MAG: flagellar hook-basal body complex protein [Rickettsiales bacterium]|nr:flagellar hook-basal body complex protein [Rickettsiales bacterium]
MDNSIYVTLGRQMALFRQMDVTANNLANANTTAYNSEHILFNTYLTKDINQGVKNPLEFTNDIRSYRNREEGALSVTGNDLDLAIKGEAYFMIETPAGVRYTRAGSFERNPQGLLVTKEGHPVLDASGQQITFPDNTTSVQVGSAGNIKVNGEDFSALGIVQFDNPELMERLDNKIYKTNQNAEPAVDITVAQGVLESANVQPITELTRMIDVSRSVTSTAKFVEIMYDLQRKTSNTWAQQQ